VYLIELMHNRNTIRRKCREQHGIESSITRTTANVLQHYHASTYRKQFLT
jgi:hypothetical protein